MEPEKRLQFLLNEHKIADTAVNYDRNYQLKFQSSLAVDILFKIRMPTAKSYSELLRSNSSTSTALAFCNL